MTADNRLPICDGCDVYLSHDCFSCPRKPFDTCKSMTVGCPCLHLNACHRAYDEGRKRAEDELNMYTLAKVMDGVHAIYANGQVEGLFKAKVLCLIDDLWNACPVPFGDCEDDHVCTGKPPF